MKISDRLNNCLYFELKVLMNCPASLEVVDKAAKEVLTPSLVEEVSRERVAVLADMAHRFSAMKPEIDELNAVLQRTLEACRQGEEPDENFDQALSDFVYKYKEEDLKLHFGPAFKKMYRLEKLYFIHQRWKAALNQRQFTSKEKREFYCFHFQKSAEFRPELLTRLQERKGKGDFQAEIDQIEEEIRQKEHRSWDFAGRFVTDNLFYQIGQDLFSAGEKLLPLQEPYRTIGHSLAGCLSFGYRLTLSSLDLLVLQSLIQVTLSEPDILLTLGRALDHREDLLLQNYPHLIMLSTLALLPSHYLMIGGCLLGTQYLASHFIKSSPYKNTLLFGSNLLALYLGEKLYRTLFAPTETLLFNQQLCAQNERQCLKEAYQVFGVEEDASFEQIKERYHEIARLNHPDKNPEGDFLTVQAAYAVIKDLKS